MGVILRALRLFLFVVLGLALMASAAGVRDTAGCNGCDRYGQVGEVKSPTWTPTEKDFEEIQSILLPGAKFEPGVKVPYIMKETIWYRLTEELTSDCFHMRHYNDTALAEYIFTAELSRTGPGDGDWQLVLSLFYDGAARELVETWTTTGTPGGCLNRMFKNPDAVMKGVKPIETLLWDFERRPAACKVRPEKDDLACGEKTSLILGGFLDEKSRESKPFNRVIVEAEKGRLLDGESVEGRPRAKAFPIDDSVLTVRYQAPDQAAAADEDLIAVYNSCDVARLDRVPLVKTTADRKIGECRVKLHCGVSPGTIVYRRTIAWEDTSSNAAGTVTYKGSLSEEATIRVDLKYKNSYQDDDYFQSTSASADYSFSYQNDTFINGKKADMLGEKVEDSGTIGQRGAPFVTLVVDRKTGAYTLEVSLGTPEKQDRGQWRININTLPDLLKGTVEGRTVRGSFTPANAGPPHQPMGSENWGNRPGTSLSWNLTLPGK